MSCLHYHSFETAVLAPFSSYAVGFSMLCNPASVRILLQFTLLLTSCNQTDYILSPKNSPAVYGLSPARIKP